MTFTTSHSGEICCCCCVFKKIYYKLFWLILLGLEIAKSNLTLDYLGRIYFPSSSLKRFHYESEIIQTVNKESVKTFLPLSSSGKKKNHLLPFLATSQFSPVSLGAQWPAEWSFNQNLHCLPDNLKGTDLVSSFRQLASGSLSQRILRDF